MQRDRLKWNTTGLEVDCYRGMMYLALVSVRRLHCACHGTRIVPMFALGARFWLRAFQPYARSKVYLDQHGTCGDAF
jgi:hypothetical protein